MKITNMNNWGLGIDTTRPVLIAGPCSAETPQQVMDSCRGAAQQGAQLLRAGIWKPRTRPDSFEGVGAIGLPWIKAAGEDTGLPVTIEVAKASHVEAALKAGIDALWIGARTTVNPFAVQEIADALRGVDVPVLVKNPINPDLGLWIGALERLDAVGIHKLAAIHRGFSVYQATAYRNPPQWDIPIGLKEALPELEIISDPSHICGRRDTLLHVAQKAVDLSFDGWMIETHVTPDAAWSDARQQVTPEGLGELLGQIVLRREDADDPQYQHQLQALREKIDTLDAELLRILGQRMAVSQQIGAYKRANNVAILQIDRWKRIFRSRTEWGLQQSLSGDFLRALLRQIHNESIRKQTEVMNDAATSDRPTTQD